MPRTSVKAAWPKKKTATQVAKDILAKAINSRRGLNPAPKAGLRGMQLQAVRTGGWANPSTSETKFIDTSPIPTLTTGVDTFTTPILLNGCIQGTEATQRLGRKIVMTSLYLKGRLSLAPTTTGGGYVRIAIVYDKQANGAAPAATDVFLTDNNTSPNNLSNRDRFVKVVDMESPVISVAGEYQVPIEIFRKLGLETTFNTGNAGTIGDITGGSLYLFIGRTSSFGVANPTFNSQCRIKFTDH